MLEKVLAPFKSKHTIYIPFYWLHFLVCLPPLHIEKSVSNSIRLGSLLFRDEGNLEFVANFMFLESAP